jgi:hypothetical protein
MDDVLVGTVTRSKVNKLELDITGLLFYHNGSFIQVLEGEKDSLEVLMSILENTSTMRIFSELPSRQSKNELLRNGAWTR